MASENSTRATEAPKPAMSLNDRFFRYFQHEVTALQEQMERLADTALAGGERNDAVDHCLAGIARLSREVKDASSYIPAYDQRTYAEAIKALSEKLQQTRSSFAPRPKFAFKSKHPSITSETLRKNNSAISLNDAAELASQQKLELPGYSGFESNSNESSFAPTPAHLRSPAPEPTGGPQTEGGAEQDDGAIETRINKQLRDIQATDTSRIRKPSFSQASKIILSSHTGLHIILPSSASHATSSGMLRDLKGCIVDMSVPTVTGRRPFAGLTLRNISNSLIICGHVSGPAHLTHVDDSVIMAACRQFRMHECRNTDVYLHCASRPIIEDCEGVRFAPLPGKYSGEDVERIKNQWDQVDDFKWLRQEKSPHWSVLPENERTKDEVWEKVVPGGPGLGVEDIMKAVQGQALV